ncbi:DUF1304 domain-containing protein [Microbacterium sp.]|uniref:DUF1304 domain-containing protein n=1 Tax=Microbacterium sp. TaxID=51671 RepID=UPI003A954816
MIIVGLVLAGLAALVHVYIFWLESVAWRAPRTRKIFGTSPEQAAMTRELAFNQGFYNLFLALAVFAGIVVFATAAVGVGLTLVFAGTGMMLAAALVLFTSAPDKRSAAVTQGLIPLLALIALVIGVVL